MPHLALYQPDIPQNVGTLLRLGACLGVPLHIIEPCGFLWGERRLRRSGMDYISQAQVHRHEDWEAFLQWQEREGGRLVLLTPHGTSSYLHMTFQPEDILLLGQESEGVPHEVEKVCDVTVAIPMLPTVRSLNVAVAGAMVLGEALRQTHQMPPFQKEI